MEQLLRKLKLARVREVYRDWIDRASKQEMSYAQFLEGLLTDEIVAREENQIHRRLRSASFPFEKTIEQFDFSFRPELPFGWSEEPSSKRQVILNYMDETFIHQGRSLVLIGPPGVGKTQPRNYPYRFKSFSHRECHRNRPTTCSVWTNIAAA